MSAVEVVDITYFSDVLCIWAYISQARVDAVTQKFGDAIRIKHHFCSVFGDTARKIPSAWSDKGSYEGFNAHLRHVAERYPHIELHPDVWLKTRPATSTSPHLFLKAVEQWERDLHQSTATSHPNIFDRVLWEFRCAFFRDCCDIARWDIQCSIARAFGVDIDAIEGHIHDGTTFALLSSDYHDADKMRIEGSPSFVLNAGRQKLYGNVGFHLIEANIRELLRTPQDDEASWC
jgi:predicted DsbA family dithiol-disulfide isomerase